MLWRARGKRRKRQGTVRKSRAKPKTGWTLRQLAALCGVQVRTLRSYLQRGLLPRPPFRGSATRYQRAQLLCAVAVRRLRESEGLDLDAIRARLEALEPPVLERWVAEQLEPGPLTTALGITLPPAASGTVPTTSSSALSSQSPRWIRVELALGVELHVREDVDGRAQELARRLQALAVDGSNALLREASRPGA